MKRASIVSLFFAAALASAALGPAGCGTGISDDLFAGSGDTAGNGTPSSSSGNAASSTSGSPAGGGGDASTSTSGNPATTASSAGAGGAGGDPSSSSSQAASSSSQAASSVAASSSSTGGGVVTLDCGGGLQCERGGQKACCWHDYDDPEVGECVEGPPNNDNCMTDGQNRETRIECQLPEHCPMGTVCCGEREFGNNTTWYSSVRCLATCLNPDIVLCDQEGEKGPDCPVVTQGGNQIQTTCKPSTLLPPGFLICSSQ
jgi:hypothetical protein